MKKSIRDLGPVKVEIPSSLKEQDPNETHVDRDGFEPWELDAEEEIPDDDTVL